MSPLVAFKDLLRTVALHGIRSTGLRIGGTLVLRQNHLALTRTHGVGTKHAPIPVVDQWLHGVAGHLRHEHSIAELAESGNLDPAVELHTLP